MTESVAVGRVFVPGLVPAYTYNPRSDAQLETGVQDYLEERGAILAVAGPTKTGKSVLLKRVLTEPVWVDGASIDRVDGLWNSVIDAHNGYTSVTAQQQTEKSAESGGKVTVGVPGVGSVSGGGGVGAKDTQGFTYAYDRPVASVARELLLASGRPLVIDDFHFVDRSLHRPMVQALKPLVLDAVPVFLVSISHRVLDAVTAVPDMRDRSQPLEVELWSHEELKFIAKKGFEVLNVDDPGERIASVLAEQSYGSPHLMQRFCREICKLNGVRESQLATFELRAPASWADFFKEQLDPAAARWFGRLLAGPAERGQKRAQFEVPGIGMLDGYGVTLLAIARTGPLLSVSKDEIRAKITHLVAGQAPPVDKTTRVLNYLSKIASKSIAEAMPTEEDLQEDGVRAEAQPVLEYMDEDSQLHIADPSFALFLKWGSEGVLRQQANRGDADEAPSSVTAPE